MIRQWSTAEIGPVKGRNFNVTISQITKQCGSRSLLIPLPKTTHGLQGIVVYFQDHTYILRMQNLSSAVLKNVVAVMQETLCDADVSLAMTRRLYL